MKKKTKPENYLKLAILAALMAATLALYPFRFGATPKPQQIPEAAPTEPSEVTQALDEDDLEFGDVSSSQPVPQLLSEYGLFKDLARQVPGDNMYPYMLNAEHFADHARVQRFFYLPEGQTATYTGDGALYFPAGSILVQTFSYPADMRAPAETERLVETRILRRLGDAWDGLSYIWNKESTDARKAIAGGLVPVSWLDDSGLPQSFKYVVPNRNDCKRCHETAGAMQAIGITAANLNVNRHHASGQESQLAQWIEQQLLAGAPPDLQAIPRLSRPFDLTNGPVEARARAWLEINCAHCHNPKGAAGVTGLDLRYSQENPVLFGVFKLPIAAGRGSEGHRYSIEPGNPATSFLISRVNSADLAVMMPPVGRRQVDNKAVALLNEWIGQMEFTPDQAERLKAKQRELYETMQREGRWLGDGADGETAVPTADH